MQKSAECTKYSVDNMELRSKFENTTLYLYWDAVQCEYYRVLGTVEGYNIELAKIYGSTKTSISLLPIGEIRTKVQAIANGMVIAQTGEQVTIVDKLDVVTVLESGLIHDAFQEQYDDFDTNDKNENIYQLHVSDDSNAIGYNLSKDGESINNYEYGHIRIVPAEGKYRIYTYRKKNAGSKASNDAQKNDRENSAESCDFEFKPYIFKSLVAHKAYKDGISLSWEYEGRADGFEVCAQENGAVLFEIQGGEQNTVTIAGVHGGATLYLQAFINTPVGKFHVAKSEPVKSSFVKFGKTRISVIIPVSNDEKYLSRCINSVLASDFYDYDIFISLGISMDNTKEIAKWYDRNFTKIHLIKSESKEAAVERCVTLSGAKYILFLNPFDRIYPNTLSRYYETIVRNGTNVVFSKVTCKRDEDSDYYEEFEFNEGAYDSEDYLTYLVKNKRIDNNRYSKMYLRTLVKSCIDGFGYEDSVFLPLVFSYAGSFSYIKDSLYERDATAHADSEKYKDDWTTFDDSIEKKSKGILFFCEQGRPAEFVPLAKYAYTQIDMYRENCKDKTAFEKCMESLTKLNEKDRLDRYEEALRAVRRKQRFIRIVIAIMIASRVVTRLFGYLQQIKEGF